MDYTFSKDFETIAMAAAAAGALGGLAWDIANPVRRFSKEPVTGLENRLTFPRTFEAGSTSGVDLGLLGPLIIGAVAGIVVVLIAGRAGPDGEEIVRQLANLSGSPDAGAAARAEDALATGVNKTTLYPLAFLGGVAGWALLEALASRLSSLFEVVVDQSAETGAAAARKAVEEQSATLPLNQEQRSALATAASDAVVTAITTANSE